MSKVSGNIVRLEINNFKSYLGKHIIGPFTNFTCIIGPNGSGKSNLMDAISFVMGLRATYLRSSNLKELIYSGDSKSQPKSASVKLVFETSDKVEIHFMRTVTSNGATEYSIDEKTTNAQEYDDKLSELGIVTKARNFLVFQGDVESIAAKNPKDLAKLFEQVSGSDQFAKEYEKLKEEKDKAEEIVITNVNKKKGINQEKNKYKLQKKEAERYQELNNEHEKTQIEYVLWRLYYIEKKIKENIVQKEKISKELEKLKQSQKTTENEMNEKKKNHSKLKRENIELGKNMKKQTKKQQDHYYSLAENKVQHQHLEKTLESQKKELEKKKSLIDAHTKEIKTLEEQMKQVQKESEEYEKQLKAAKKKEIKLNDSQIDEYNKLKEKAGTETITLTQELGTFNEEIESLKKNQEILSQRIEQFENRKNQLQKQIESFHSRIEKLSEVISEAEKQLSEKKKLKQKLDRENEERKTKKEELEAKLIEIKDKLQDYRQEKKENERDIKFNESLESMKRLFPGVKGRLPDLSKITQNKFTAAITVAMGKNMNAVVVDTEKTAIDCIEYLKEQRIGKATFLPLDSIKGKKINEKLRKLGDDVKLAIDVIGFDEIYTNVFLYALGNTIVCDTLDIANKICFDSERKERVKAVTLDGTVISKAGLITGGLAEIEKDTAKWQEKDVSSLKQKRDQYLQEIQDLSRDELSSSTISSKNDSEIAHIENRIKYTNVDINFTQKKLETAEQEVGSIEKELKELKPQNEEIQKKLSTLTKSSKKIESSIKEIEDKIFGDFSKKVGVDNLREYEENQLKTQQESIKKRQEFKVLISRFQSKLEYENTRNLKEPLDQISKSVKENEKKIEKLEDDAESISEEIKKEESESKKLKQQAKDLKTQIEDVENTILQIKNQMDDVNKTIQKKTRSMTSKENEIEQLRNKRQETYRKCQVEEIELPTNSQKQEPKKKRTKKQKKEEQEEEEEEKEEEIILSSEKFSVSQEKDSQRTREEFEEISLDFSSLTKNTLNLSDDDYDKMEKEYKKQLIEISNEISKLAPSSSSLDKLKSVTEKFNETEESVKNAKNSSKEAKKKFEEIKQKRYDTFMKAFEPISQVIDSIYKQLTKSEQSKMGGTAYLGLEDIEEPYNHGVKFNAMPPLKRYRDMEELSGGEKTVAALALLFAIHHYRPSPFFILDEVDAALDNANVQKVANFVLNQSNQVQFLVISLKDSFFSQSEALVGICKDKLEKSSKCLTIDLRDYEEEKEEIDE